MSEPSAKAIQAGIRALSRRELSRAELATRLGQSGIEPEDAQRASAYLTAKGYQSDERTACERARVLAARLYGDLAIKVDLERRSIGACEIDVALATVEPEESRAEVLAHRVGDGARLVQTLRRKGYAEATIERSSCRALRTQGNAG